MQVKFNCSYCHAKIGAEDEFCGMAVQCPGCEQNITVPSARFGTGAQLGGYRIDQFLGNGAMGEVYLATQLSMDRKVALKIISKHVADDEEDRERFAREIRLLAKLNHQNIVTAFEAGEEDGCQFLAMGFIDGQGLDERLDRDKTLPEAEALDICLKVAEALKYAWERFGLLHRDIKPANIMIDKYDEVKLMDMGIAKTAAEESSATMTGMVIGTPYYMSPEQARASEDLDFRSDMYGLGATLYHLVTGEYSHNGANPMDVLTKKLSQPVVLAREVNPKVSEACEALLVQILEVDRDARPQSWDVVIERMRRVRQGKMPIRSTKTHAVKRRKLRVGTPTAPTLSREDIEEIESEVEALSKKKPVKGIVLAIIVALLAAIAALIFLATSGNGQEQTGANDDNSGTVSVSDPGADAAAAAAAAAAEKATKEKQKVAAAAAEKRKQERATRAEAALVSAEAFHNDNPTDFRGSMDQFQKAVSIGEGTDVARKAYQRVQDMRAARETLVEHVMAYLASRAYRVARKGNWAAADGIYRAYRGPVESETGGLRDELSGYEHWDEEERTHHLESLKSANDVFHSKFDGKPPKELESAAAPNSSGSSISKLPTKPQKKVDRSALESISLKAASALIRSDFSKAKKSLQDEVRRSSGVQKKVLERMLARVEEISKMSDLVVEGLRKDIGKEMTVQVAKGSDKFMIVPFVKGADRFVMSEVTATEIKGAVILPAGKLGKRYRFADLSTAEYLKRLEMSGTSEMSAMRGIIACRLRRFDVADQSFGQVGSHLGKALQSTLLSLSPTLREGKALTALRDMLRDLGIAGMTDPAEALRKLNVESLSEARLSEIRATATAMREKHAKTDLVREQRPLLDMLCGLSKVVWPLSAEKVAFFWDADRLDGSVGLATRGDAKISPGSGLVVGDFGGAVVERRREGRVLGDNGMTIELFFTRKDHKEEAGQILSFEDEDKGVLGLYSKGDQLILEMTVDGELREIPLGNMNADSAHVSIAFDQGQGRVRGAIDGVMLLDAEMTLDGGAMRRTKLVLGATRRADRTWSGTIDSLIFYSDAQIEKGFATHYEALKAWRSSKKR